MNQYITLLTLLLQDSVIASLEYWSEFILRIQRDEARRHPILENMFSGVRIPSLLCLRMRSEWWVGERPEWENLVKGFPMKGISPLLPEAPLQASTLMTMLGTEISEVVVDERSDLRLNLTDGRSVLVKGTCGAWEESWFLELPVDDPDRALWSIVCDSQGSIAGKSPMPIRL